MNELEALKKEAMPEYPKVKILHVDDEPMLLSAFKRTIRQIGKEEKWNVEINSQERVEGAMGVIQPEVEGAMGVIQPKFDPDVIFSDMTMPGQTGQDFLEILEKDHPALVSRFCFVSGGGLSPEHQKLLEYMKAIGRMIGKPFEPHQIRDVIRSILKLK